MLSTVMPNSVASFKSKRSFTILYPGHWSEHTGVQAAGTNDSTTVFFPRYWLRVTFPPETEGRVKSGAGSPTFTLRILSVGFRIPVW